MNMRMLFALLAAFALGSFGPARADESAPPADPTLMVVEDPAFERFIDLKAVGDALVAQDAGRLTDLALQLAHGEQVLYRPHKELSSQKLFTVALKVAAEKRDQAALKRLERVIRQGQDKELLARLDASLLLAKGARKANPGLAVSVENVTPEGFVIYKSMLDEVNLAKTLNDRPGLENIQRTLATLSELTTQQKAFLAGQIREALAAMPETTTDTEDNVLSRLARASRGLRRPPEPLPKAGSR